MVEVKQNGEQDSKGNSNKHIPDPDVPEMHKPVPVGRWGEGLARRQGLEVHIPHAPNVHEAREEDDRQRRPVILDEHADVVLEQGARADDAAQVADDEHEQGDDDGEVEGLGGTLAGEHLDAFLQVDEGDVEAEDVAREAGYWKKARA